MLLSGLSDREKVLVREHRRKLKNRTYSSNTRNEREMQEKELMERKKQLQVKKSKL